MILDSSTLDDELQDENSFDDKVDVLANSFDEMNMTREDFVNLDCLIIPYLVQESHFALLGFAPKQNFTFAIDSGNRNWGLKDALLHPILLHFAPSGYKK